MGWWKESLQIQYPSWYKKRYKKGKKSQSEENLELRKKDMYPDEFLRKNIRRKYKTSKSYIRFTYTFGFFKQNLFPWIENVIKTKNKDYTSSISSSNKKPSIVATFIQQCLTPLQYNLIMKEKEEDMSEKQRQHWYTIETCLSLGTTNVDESMCIQFIYIYIYHSF